MAKTSNKSYEKIFLVEVNFQKVLVVEHWEPYDSEKMVDKYLREHPEEIDFDYSQEVVVKPLLVDKELSARDIEIDS